METKTKKKRKFADIPPREFQTASLAGLKGVGHMTVEAAQIRSVTAAIQALRQGYVAITASGDNGAINVWRTVDGTYRCERQRFMIKQDEGHWKYLSTVAEWLRENLPRIK